MTEPTLTNIAEINNPQGDKAAGITVIVVLSVITFYILSVIIFWIYH